MATATATAPVGTAAGAAAASNLPDFHLPAFSDSSNGWGPSSHSLPTHLLGLPFMPFNKGEKLSKISDWSYNRDARGAALKVAEEEEIGGEDEGGAFSVVDTKVKPKPRFGYRPFQQQQRRPGQFNNPNQQGRQQQREEKRNTTTTTVQQQAAAQQAAAAAASQGSGKVTSTIGSTAWNTLANTGGNAWTQQQTGVKRSMQTGAGQSQAPTGQRAGATSQRGGFQGGRPGQGQRRGFFHEQKEQKPPSVEVKEEWKAVAEVELSELTGVTFEPLEDEDLLFAGSLLPFNPAFNRVTPRTAIPLSRYESRQFFAASTTEDPILTGMIEAKEGTVFATDAILSLLMSASKSVYSWDLLVRKEGDVLVFDKRADSKIDYLSVNENHSEHLSDEKDNINHADHLALEATVINHNFSQQSLSPSPSLDFETPNPFLSSLTSGNEPAAVAFRYHSWSLGGGVKLVARSSINAYAMRGEQPIYLISRVLNEFDSKISGSVEWRQKLESQTGAALAIEMKNNAYRLARYVSDCLISACDEIKVGFVSRMNTKNSYRHAVLMCKTYDVKTFSDSINVKTRGLWGSLKVVIDRLRQLDDGHYLMLRDPNKPTIHIYAVPADAFQGEGEVAAEMPEE